MAFSHLESCVPDNEHSDYDGHMPQRRKTPSQSPTQAALEASEQGAFFARMDATGFASLFSGLEGVTFFVKDLDGRFMGFSASARQGLNFGLEHDLLGMTDFDLYPRSIAERIYADDQKILQSRQPLLNIVELLVNPVHSAIGWYVTNKFPVFDRQEAVIGIMGTVQPYEGRRKRLLAGTRLDDVVEQIRQCPAEKHSVESLAKSAGMSSRQLARHFHSVLGMSPRDFRMLCRMQQACEFLIQRGRSIGEIALETGFYDQSAFAFQFRRTIGMAPLEYRTRYRDAAMAQASG